MSSQINLEQKYVEARDKHGIYKLVNVYLTIEADKYGRAQEYRGVNVWGGGGGHSLISFPPLL